ncbi:MAG: O-methyltransferase [Candidatus Eisenbacteria sp.]|nr:O-methyltransferase [Candidatus Eisenbacteria bacterium]
MDILTRPINEYLKAHLPARDEILREMEAYAAKQRFPIVGPLCGAFLRQLALLSGARRVLEMGSGFGYSAYWFLLGMPADGRVICTDGDVENRDRAMAYLERAGLAGRVEFHVGDALEITPGLEGPFDIIYNDIDKEQYPAAFNLAIPRLRPGGVFVSDNALWSGRILDAEPAPSTRGILEFNRRLFGTAGILGSIVPLRDGLGLAVKTAE